MAEIPKIEKPKSVWEVLSKIDCSNHIKILKNGKAELKYLSWAWAWGILIENYPDATYEVREWEGFPYLFDGNLGYMVETSVTIDGKKLSMRLPTMDGANKAQKHIQWSYEVNEWVWDERSRKSVKTGKMTTKYVEAATMFDINTTIMRCLVKNIAMFGLGHYIYAGEDLPMQDELAPDTNQKSNIQMPQKTNGAAKPILPPPAKWTYAERKKKIDELLKVGVDMEKFLVACKAKGIDEVTDKQIQEGINKKKIQINNNRVQNEEETKI